MNNNELAITSLSEFLSVLKNYQTVIRNKKTNLHLFYRGHANELWEVRPSAYRDIDRETYLNKEYRAYQEMLCKAPSNSVMT